MNIKTKRKTAVAFVLSMLILMLSVVCCMPKIADAATASQRTYRRHDYSNSNLASYTSYTLKLETDVNMPTGRAVIGDNNFVQDSDNAVVRLDYGDFYRGTGFIIDEHTIVTAAHCIYNSSNKCFYNFTISITDTVGNILENIKPKYVHIPTIYADNNNKNYDYAMIEVEEDLSEYEFFSLGVATDTFIDLNSTVTVAGYPQYDFDGDGQAEWQARYKASGNITSIIKNSSFIINYTADTSGGSSGGPVYVERNYFGTTYKTVIAINRGHYLNECANLGVKITSDLLKFYYGNNEKKY